MKAFTKVIGLVFLTLGVFISNLAAEDIEKYPSKPIIWFHAYPPGGSTDLVARVMSSVAPKYFGQPLVVTPKPGGAGLVVLQALAESKPDGYTLHHGRGGEMTNGPFIEKMPFAMEQDFIPIARIATDYGVLALSTKRPWKTIEEFIAAAKKEPGKITFTSAGSVSDGRIKTEYFCSVWGIKLTHVPFKGQAPATMAVAGGHVDLLCGAYSDVLPHTQTGTMRVILAVDQQRSKLFPDVPIPKEKGWDFPMGAWHTIFAPKGTPPAIVAKVENVLRKVTSDEDYVSALTKVGCTPEFYSAQDFVKYWKDERKKMGKVIKDIGLGYKE